ncbi:hypothetical protein [Streptomyces sp. NBC_00280]|uniref:hypothetical protein n=1 Tax=Streptomyces sp. NBC_00280 TaxID=2975699 RepID=UPI003246032C
MTDETENSIDSGRGRFRKHLTWLIGILAGVAGIVAAVVGLWPDPDFTLKAWAERADAVCDDTNGEQADALRTAVDAWGNALSKFKAGTATVADFVETGDLYNKLAGVSDKQAGDLSDIQKPDRDSDEERVKVVISNFRAANRMIYAATEKLRAVDPNNPQVAVDGFNTKMKSYDKKAHTVNDGLSSLGANQCVPPVNY